ncbi:hypothetical protein [Sphingobacterium griseoflavum]|nr:hypothetical protein [Sphingobacterium griseoflavum]
MNLPAYLAKCINKDRPELHCNGQCVLMKKLKEQEKKDAKKNMLVYETSALYVHKERFTFSIQSTVADISPISFFFYAENYSFDHNQSVFRPPVSSSRIENV